jgi:hypothetical protein
LSTALLSALAITVPAKSDAAARIDTASFINRSSRFVTTADNVFGVPTFPHEFESINQRLLNALAHPHQLRRSGHPVPLQT